MKPVARLHRFVLMAAISCFLACQAIAGLEKKDLPGLDADIDPAGDADVDADREDPAAEEDPAEQDGIDDEAGEAEAETDGFTCEPGENWCNGDGDIEMCNVDGTSTSVTTCGLGCSDTPDTHCLVMVPSNLEDGSYFCMPGLVEPVLSTGVSRVYFDTDTGEITEYDASYTLIATLRAAGEGMVSGINFDVVPQETGYPALGVFSLEAFTLPEGIDLRFRGAGVPVIIACTDVLIEGIVTVAARRSHDGELSPGPGGFAAAAGPGAGVSGTNSSTGRSGGGGGGAFGGYGGRGGITTYGGSGGSPYGNDELVPLVGGSGGGNGTDNDPNYGMGGPGGGALQISALGSIVLDLRGIIEAGGLGGTGGDGNGSGGGAGSGGGILLEAPTITVGSGAFVAANGGGGGSSGDYNTGALGLDGQTGRADNTAAAGGAVLGPDACAGGAGNDDEDMNGVNAACSVANGGGGGGSAGRIRLNAIDLGVAPSTTSPLLGAPGSATTSGSPVLL